MNAGHDQNTHGPRWAARVALAAAILSLALGCTSLREHMAMKDAATAYKAGKYDVAASAWKRALSYNPRRAENWKNLGYCYWNLIEPGSKQAKDKELTQEALDAFQKYLEIKGKDDSIQDYIINLYMNQDRLDDGIRYYEQMLRENPTDARILQTLAVMYGKTGNFEKSLEYSEKKANLDRSDPSGYLFIGALCWQRSYNKQDPDAFRAKMVDKGFEAVDKALALKPMSFEGHLYKGLLYRQKQDLATRAAENEKDRRAKKALLDQADEFLRLANLERDKALEVRKAQQTGTAASSPAAPSTN